MTASSHADLAPTEHELAGQWIETDDGPRGDEIEQRIAWLVSHRLDAMDRSADGWDWLFRDPRDGRLWELTFPLGSLHGRGPRLLRHVSAAEAAAKYERVLVTDAPRRGWSRLQAIGRAALRVAGWRIVGDVPREPKFVIIVAPHTSNWDFIVGVLAMFALDLDIHWFGKHSLFRWPLGALLRRLGGRPVRRDTPEGVVAEVADAVRAAPDFILALAPEGTRRRVTQWRTGFYRIAERAGVPVVPVWLDWGRREVGIGKPMRPTGNLAADLRTLQALYRADMARRREGFWSAIL